MPKSVFSLGNGLSSIEAWITTALDIEEVLCNVGGDQLHVMVADVVKSFDTVDRSIPDCALGRLGLLAWFKKVYFARPLSVLPVGYPLWASLRLGHLKEWVNGWIPESW